jgi:iduronate 2-sulfatase
MKALPPALNVLFIIVDDLRVDPQMETPCMDALRRRGVSFDRAFAQLSLCGPSRASFLTGMRPDSTGVYDLVTPWRARLGGLINDGLSSSGSGGFGGRFGAKGLVEDHWSLPRVFREAGYGHVLGVGKIFHPSKPPLAAALLDDPKAWTRPVELCDQRPLYPPAPEDRAASGLRVRNTFPAAAAAAAAGAAAAAVAVARPAVASLDVDDDYFRDGQIAASAVRTLRTLAAEGANAPLLSGAATSHSTAASPTTPLTTPLTTPPPTKGAAGRFFVAVGFTKPHLPWVVPERFFSKYEPRRARIKVAANPTRQARTPRWVLDKGAELFAFEDVPSGKGRGADPGLSADEQRILRHGYYAAASCECDAYIFLRSNE